MRKTPFVEGEYYHIYNRGVEKRNIFSDQYDLDRFFQSMEEFNVVEPIGSIYENSFVKDKIKNKPQLGSRSPKSDKLVNFICYCLNPNHYHFILEPVVDKGMEKFMQRLGGGYTNYFNNKHKRNGVLFQGKFKSRHIDSDLLDISVYVNLNNHVHQLGSPTSKLHKSSWDEYRGKSKENFCCKDIILQQFENSNEYMCFAKDVLGDILERKKEKKEIESLLIE